MRFPRTSSSYCTFVLILITLLISGCGGEPGRVRATPAEVAGVYEAKFGQGSEILQLKTDRTYAQDFTSENKSIHHSGVWKIENHFLGGIDVVLVSCVVSEDDMKVPDRIGDRILNVHNRSGKLALAIN